MLSQSKNSGCSIAQPRPCIAGNNVLNKWYARTTVIELDNLISSVSYARTILYGQGLKFGIIRWVKCEMS